MDIELEVMEQVEMYFKENLPKYTVLEVRKKSYHHDDSHLYMVSAKKDDGTYAVWTCWNYKLKSLNYGHPVRASYRQCFLSLHTIIRQRMNVRKSEEKACSSMRNIYRQVSLPA